MTDDDELQECVNCGHARRFHLEPSSARQTDNRPCMNPEDGAPCTCEGFQPA